MFLALDEHTRSLRKREGKRSIPPPLCTTPPTVLMFIDDSSLPFPFSGRRRSGSWGAPMELILQPVTAEAPFFLESAERRPRQRGLCAALE